MEYVVYAIYNPKHQKIYIGQTSNLQQRLDLHNNREFKHCYTSRFDGRWNMIYQEKVSSRIEALQREKQLKSYQGRKFVKTLIKP